MEPWTIGTRELMDRLVFSILLREDVKGTSPFRYIGYVWVRQPGWFFWPKDRAGVFHLKEHARHAAGEDESVSFARAGEEGAVPRL